MVVLKTVVGDVQLFFFYDVIRFRIYITRLMNCAAYSLLMTIADQSTGHGFENGVV